MMELLAPAGTPEAFKVAVAAGADAVYLGGSRFGARHFAGNFSDSDLEEAVAYAHLRGVKVYVTVNILVHDYELPEVLEYLLFLSSLGIDAVLIQDLGVLSLAQKLFGHQSGFPALHASTQMTIHNREGADFARERGCVRIVLARELPSREVHDIADFLRDQGCEIEIFGHGALCYGYSGQCLLSAVIGGRSGNRGMCAQPCRKPYSVVMGKRDSYGRMSNPKSLPLADQYLLSTRDLSTYPVLKSIASLPIAAIKIEGRMRSPQYVATTVSVYRRALDAIKAGTFSPVSDDEIDLAVAFSRGFTTGYLNDQSDLTVMGRDLPGRRGLLVGTVTGITPDGLMILDPYYDLVPERGDGLVCIGRAGDKGFVLRHDSRIQKKKLYLNSGVSCHAGDQVYLTSRKRNSHVLDHLMQDPDQRFYGSIALSLLVVIDSDGSVNISGSIKPRSGRLLPLSYRSEAQLSPARSRPLHTEQIRDALQKMGGTLFSLKHLEIICPDNLFAPVSVLNGIRREILDVAERTIMGSFRPAPEVLAGLQDTVEFCRVMVSTRKTSNDIHHDPIHLIILVSDTDSAIAALSSGVSRVYLEWYPHPDQESDTRFLEEILTLVLHDPPRSEQIGIKIPKILFRLEMDRIIAALPDIRKAGIRHLMVDGIGVAEAMRLHIPDLEIAGYSGLNITNHLSLSVFSGYEFCTLSCELSGEEVQTTMAAARAVGGLPPAGVIVQGILEAVVTQDRLEKIVEPADPTTAFGLRDQKGQIFPLVTDPCGRTHIFNAAETSLIDQIEMLQDAGIRYGVIDARWRGSLYSRDMTRIWSDVLKNSESGVRSIKNGEAKEAIRTCAYGVLTSATWKRGLCRSE